MARKRVLTLLMAAVFVVSVSVAVAQASTHGRSKASTHGRSKASTHGRSKASTHGRSHRHEGNHGSWGGGAATATPVKHVVVIYQENVSFDHYFGTYPHAGNTDGSPFYASRRTPSVNGLTDFLLTQNPNGSNPTRLSRSENYTCDQNHDYKPEQQAFDNGLMDKFIPFTNNESCTPPDITKPGLVMDYYDGNTVTALWNYAQHFSMSDNSYSSTFGPSTPGALNLVSGQTHGAVPTTLPDVVSNGTDIGDADPAYDDCSSGSTFAMTGKNVGDLLNAKGITWGWFQGGFKPTSTTGGKAVCATKTPNLAGVPQTAYSPHHEPFQYYQSTSNPHHLPPSSVSMIGKTDQANHQYDLSDFWAAVGNGNMPAVSFLKATRAQDGHAGYSSPLDEQQFIVNTLNRLQQTRDWKSTAVIIAYDDSDGWYDHQMSPIVMQSNDPAYDALTGPGQCGTAKPGAYQDRCGYGPRQPLLVISPFARVNSVDHSITDQTSILRFIEDNWSTGRIGDQSFDAIAGSLNNLFNFRGEGDQPPHKLFLDPNTGEPTRGSGWGH
jgi:phospholipase C